MLTHHDTDVTHPSSYRAKVTETCVCVGGAGAKLLSDSICLSCPAGTFSNITGKNFKGISLSTSFNGNAGEGGEI